MELDSSQICIGKKQINMNMASSSLLTCIHSALLDIDLLLKHPLLHAMDLTLCYILKLGLRNLKVFAVLSEEFFRDNLNLASLLGRFDDTVRRTSEKFHDLILDLADNDDAGAAIDMAHEFCYGQLQPLMEEKKKWLVPLFDIAGRQSTSLTTNEFSEIISCTLENAEVFITILGSNDVSGFRISMKVFQEQMTLLYAHVCFASQSCVVETRDLLAHTEAVVFYAAAFLFVCEDFYGSFGETKDRLEFVISKTVQKIKNRQIQFYETYCQALVRSKIPGQSYALTRQDMDDNDTFIAVEKALNFIVPSLWEILRMNSGWVVSVKDKPHQLFEALRSLRKIILKKQYPNSIKKDIGAAICDAGVLISLLHETTIEVDLGLLKDLIETIKSILAEVGDEEPQLPQFNLPMTNQLGFIDSVIEKLMVISSYEAELTANYERVQTIIEELVYFRAFLGNIVKLRNQQEKLQALCDRVLEMTCRVEELIDLLVVGDVSDSFLSSYDSIMKDFGNIKSEIEVKRQEINVNEATNAYSHVPAQPSSSMRTNQIVGFADEANSIIDQLKRGTKKLRMIAIVGMPGLGKTILATKVYNDPSIVHHFQVRLWSTISQVVNKGKVLRELLNQIDTNSRSYVTSEMTEHDVVAKLWRSLKGKKIFDCFG